MCPRVGEAHDSPKRISSTLQGSATPFLVTVFTIPRSLPELCLTGVPRHFNQDLRFLSHRLEQMARLGKTHGGRSPCEYCLNWPAISMPISSRFYTSGSSLPRIVVLVSNSKDVSSETGWRMVLPILVRVLSTTVLQIVRDESGKCAATIA